MNVVICRDRKNGAHLAIVEARITKKKAFAASITFRLATTKECKKEKKMACIPSN